GGLWGGGWGGGGAAGRGRAIERPGQGHALPLAGGESPALIADRGVIALRQAQDEVVGLSPLSRSDDGLGVDGAEAGDVVGDGAVEELDVLGDVADPGAEVLQGPVGEFGAVAPGGAG